MITKIAAALDEYCNYAREWWDYVLYNKGSFEHPMLQVKGYANKSRSCIKGVAVFPYVTSSVLVTFPVECGFRQLVSQVVPGYQHNGITCIVKSNLHGINNANQFVALIDTEYLSGNNRMAEPIFMSREDARKIYDEFHRIYLYTDDLDRIISNSLLNNLFRYINGTKKEIVE